MSWTVWPTVLSRRADLLEETCLPQMIKEVVIESDIDSLLRRIGGRVGRRLRGKHDYTESLVNRNLDS